MLKRIIYLILLAQLLIVGCSSLNGGGDQFSVDNIRKTQEIAKISRDVYDLQNILKNDDVNFSTLSSSFKVFGIKEYLTVAELVTDLSIITKSLDDKDLSLEELEQYSKLTGILVQILDSSDNTAKSASVSTNSGDAERNQSEKSRNVVTLAEINAIDIDSIEEFVLPENTVLLSTLDIIDTLYYSNNQLYSGMAYSTFKNGQISEFKTIKDGFLSGPVYSWYEDGSYAMEANFLNGYLAGRFIAWSEVGDVIYDIYFNKGQFKSDLQYERDNSREDSEMDSAEGESDSEAGSGE